MQTTLKELKQKNEKLLLLMDAAKTIMADIDLDSLLALTVLSVQQVMSSDRATLFLVDLATKELVSKVTLDGSEIRMPAGAGIVGYVTETGETVNIPDAYKDKRFNQEIDKKIGYRTKSILCMPVHNPKNDIIGAIQVLNKTNQQPFNPGDEELLSAFSSLIGISLENARAYDELEKERNSLDEKVKERTKELSYAKQETDRILDTVDQGLFLLYRNEGEFKLGQENSRALHQILAAENIQGEKLEKLLTGKLEPKRLENAQKFLTLLFDKSKNASMLQKLNPLRETTFQVENQKRFLRFKFDRIILDNQVDHIMGAVTDATAEVELNARLAQAEAENKKQMQLLFLVLQTEPAVLSEFLLDIDDDLQVINNILKDNTKADLKQKLELIFRITHTIKGNAALLDFSTLANQAHSCEDTISALMQKEAIQASDFLSVAIEINKIAAAAKELKGYIKKIKSFQTSMGGHEKTDLTIRSLKKIIEAAEDELKKKIAFLSNQYDASVIPKKYRKVLKDSLIQLTRNSIHHGIELPAIRQQKGKPETGTIRLTTEVIDNVCIVEFRDDGQGLDVSRIKKKAIERGLIEKHYSKNIAALIFKPGFSTDEQASMAAGRGMGMNIIKSSIENQGGKLQVGFAKDKYCWFKMLLPINA